VLPAPSVLSLSCDVQMPLSYSESVVKTSAWSSVLHKPHSEGCPVVVWVVLVSWTKQSATISLFENLVDATLLASSGQASRSSSEHPVDETTSGQSKKKKKCCFGASLASETWEEAQYLGARHRLLNFFWGICSSPSWRWSSRTIEFRQQCRDRVPGKFQYDYHFSRRERRSWQQ
jgi:hypothetical protein